MDTFVRNNFCALLCFCFVVLPFTWTVSMPCMCIAHSALSTNTSQSWIISFCCKQKSLIYPGCPNDLCNCLFLFAWSILALLVKLKFLLLATKGKSSHWVFYHLLVFLHFGIGTIQILLRWISFLCSLPGVWRYSPQCLYLLWCRIFCWCFPLVNMFTIDQGLNHTGKKLRRLTFCLEFCLPTSVYALSILVLSLIPINIFWLFNTEKLEHGYLDLCV